MKEKRKGLVHVYCGDGKGKTTAAVGLAVRCAGGGGKVLFYQFLKDGTSGEIAALKKIDGVDVIDGYVEVRFSKFMTDDDIIKAKKYYRSDFHKIIDKVFEKDYDLLVLDEVTHAVNNEYILIDELMRFLENKPYDLEVVLTGRNPHNMLCDFADYVSEILKIKHPFDLGIKARKFIEK